MTQETEELLQAKEKIDFLESVIEKQKNLLYHYERSLGKISKEKDRELINKQLDIDLAYLDHLKETQNIVLMRKTDKGWSKYETNA